VRRIISDPSATLSVCIPRQTGIMESLGGSEGVLSDPTGARTQDPNIKSVMLYQLSYRIGRPLKSGCKYTLLLSLGKANPYLMKCDSES